MATSLVILHLLLFSVLITLVLFDHFLHRQPPLLLLFVIIHLFIVPEANILRRLTGLCLSSRRGQDRTVSCCFRNDFSFNIPPSSSSSISSSYPYLRSAELGCCWALCCSSMQYRSGLYCMELTSSLWISVGLSALPDNACHRASMVAVSSLTFVSGKSSTVGLAMSELAAVLWIFGISPPSSLLSHSSLCRFLSTKRQPLRGDFENLIDIHYVFYRFAASGRHLFVNQSYTNKMLLIYGAVLTPTAYCKSSVVSI